MFRVFVLLVTAIVSWIALPREAHAACALCSCSVSAADVSFGAFQPLDNAPLDGAGTVTVSCGPIGLLVSYDLKLSAGGSGGYATRRMTGGGHTLDYNLYTSPSRTTIWGDGSGGSGFVSDAWLISLGQMSRAHVVYGRVPAAPAARPGAYSDTIIARIEW